MARLAALGGLAVLTLLGGIPAYLWLDPAWRPLGVRVACVLAVAAACTRVRRAIRRAIDDAPPSAVDARPDAPAARQLDERFLRARDDLVFSRRSRRYFDAVLWPRLLRLAGDELTPPAPRRGPGGWGPSRAALGGLIGEVERRA